MLAIAGIIGTLAGIIATFYVFHRQKQRGRIQIKVDIKEELFDRSRKNAVYLNSDPDWAIDVTIRVKSHYKLPLRIESFFLAVSSSSPFKSAWIIKNWPIADNIAMDTKGYKLPASLPPGEELEQLYLTGRDIAQTLERRNYRGVLTVMFGVIDENKNVYYSDPIRLDVQKWLRDRGQWLMLF